MKNNYSWANENYYDLGWSWDILDVAVHDDKEYYGSWYDGVSVLDGKKEAGNYRFLSKYEYENTNGALYSRCFWFYSGWIDDNCIFASSLKDLAYKKG